MHAVDVVHCIFCFLGGFTNANPSAFAAAALVEFYGKWNAEAEAWGLNAVGKADIFLKTKKGGVAKKGKRASGGAPTPKQLAAQTFHVDAKSRKKMKRQLKQVRGARLKVPA